MQVRSHFGSSFFFFLSATTGPFICPGAAMAPKSVNKGNCNVRNISIEDRLSNPFLEVPNWGKSWKIMKDIGNAQKWATTM